MKRNAIMRIILNSILALILTAILINGLVTGGLNFIFSFGNGGTVVEDEVTFETSQVRNLEINWAAGSVQIRAADTDRITVSESRPKDSKYKLTYRLSGNTLELDYTGGTIGIGFGNWNMPSKDLIITVPRDWVCETLQIDGASLDIELQDLNVGEIELDGAACTLDFAGEVDRVDIDGASADITLNCTSHVSAINVDGASCDLDVILPKGCGFRVEMDGLSCGFHSDLDYSQGNGRYTFGDQYCKVNVDGVSCDVTIQESSECAHVWDAGQEMTVPGSSDLQMVYTCTLCGKTRSETISMQRYTITCANDFTADMLMEPLEEQYTPGTVVKLKTDILTDVDLELYVNGEFVCKQTEGFSSDGTNHWEFYFTMPSEAVVIQFKTTDSFLLNP